MDRLSEAREDALAVLVDGSWTGTEGLVRQIMDESRHAEGWRPGRAALMTAALDAPPIDGPYLTPEQFADWKVMAKALAKAKGWEKPEPALGLTPQQLRLLRARGVTSKAQALAMAHYLCGLPMPVPAGDSDALQAWYRPRFGGTERVAAWLDMDDRVLADRLRGFSLQKQGRTPRPPEPWLVRALAWLWRMGPYCPYGPKAPITGVWPSQEEGGR